jgi:hypothetical protein
MGTRTPSQRGDYRINLRLDPELDSDLISWLESVPRGQRSDVLRAIIREGLKNALLENQQEASMPDLDAIRFVVADEIRKALKEKQFTSEAPVLTTEQHDMESRYGDKLNRMLGGFSSHRDGSG